jgi:hypothetical protein
MLTIFQAGLALWSYGVISNVALTETALDSIGNAKRGESIALLEETDSNGAQRFINLNKGQAKGLLATPAGVMFCSQILVR